VLTNRARPSSDEGRAHWHGPGFTHDQSFPSGEVTAAFSCATILAEEWKDLPGAAPVSYGVASLVALERINDNAHWASDVFTAAVLGYGVSQAVERLHPMTSTHLGIIAIVPIVTAREKALSVTLSF
jgi:membrane-associated phospholipid phosphatase